MMRTGWLTGILLALGVIVLVAVPPVRQAAVEAYRTYNLPGTKALPTKLEYEKIARAHPQDAAIWLGFAQAIDTDLAEVSRAHVPDWDEGSTWTATQAYEQAILISPRSPAPYLRYALHFLAGGGFLDRKEERGAERQEEPQLTRPEVRNLRQAESLLKQARRLDRENAACDYLLASIYLAEHRDEEAFAALQAATEKPHWDFASQEAATGLLHLMDATHMAKTLVPTVAMALHAGEFPLFVRLKSLTATLVGLGEEFREKGRHKEAILCYEAAMHLGHVMREDAYSLIEGLVAVAITHITSGPFLSEEQRQHIEKDTPINQEPWSRQQPERSKRMQEARVANFVAYLTQHGRADLAEFYEEEMQAANEWRKAAKATIGHGVARLMLALYGGAMRYAGVVWAEAGALLALWVLIGLLSVIARYWREGPVGLSSTYGQWAQLLGIAIMGVLILTAWPKPEIVSDEVSTKVAFSELEIPVSAGIGILAWLVVALVMTLRKRARQTAEQRLGKARCYLASLRTLLPPTFAALLLLSVIALWPAHRSLQEWADEQRTMIEQGEVKYWGIGEDDGQDIG